MKYILTTLEVSDLERSLRFYHDTLQLPVITRFKGGPDTEIAMLGDPAGAHLELICRSGQVHLPEDIPFSVGFEVHHAQVLAASIDPNYQGPISPNPTLRFFFVRDPDGYRVQLMEHLKG